MQEAEEVSQAQQQQQQAEQAKENESKQADIMSKSAKAQLDLAKAEETLVNIVQ